MKHHIMWANELRVLIEPDPEVVQLLEEYDELVDVFVCEHTAVVVIPTIHYKHYDTHPNGELGTVVRRVQLTQPLTCHNYFEEETYPL